MNTNILFTKLYSRKRFQSIYIICYSGA